MGIFDGVLGGQGGIAAQNRLGGVPTESMNDAYNNHIQKLQDEELQRQQYAMQANVYSQQLAQSMMNTKQAVAQSAYQQTMKPFNPNELGAYQIPLSQLVTLWRAKYGDEWVETFDEEFWQDALSRLKVADKLETARHWFRIKEDA